MDEFWANLLTLSLTLPMFPHPQDLLSSGCKVQRDGDLTIAAATITRSAYPKSIALPNLDAIKDACKNQALVIKRDFSDSTSCTFLPGAANREAEVEAKYRETSLLYEGIKRIPRPAWMGQPFNRHLAEKGELRAFVIGGRLQYTIHTMLEGDGRFYHAFVDNYTPLHLLR